MTITAIAARRAAGSSSGLTAGSLEPLLGYLRSVGAVPVPPLAAQTPVGALLVRYGAWLARDRCLAVATIERNTGLVRLFLDGQVRDGRRRRVAGGDREALRILLVVRQEITEAATAQASRLRALPLAGNATGRLAARTTLSGRALTALAGRELR